MYNHILIPVAPRQGKGSMPALDIAERLKSDGGTISALTVLEEIPAYVDAYIPAETHEVNVKESLSDLEEAFGDRATPHAMTGQPSRSILNWAEKHGVDCIVMASHQPGFSDYFLGSTAGRVVRHAHCPVFVLR